MEGDVGAIFGFTCEFWAFVAACVNLINLKVYCTLSLSAVCLLWGSCQSEVRFLMRG